jgi:hypothetical protein
VYELRIDREAAVIAVVLDGNLRAEDMGRFAREVQEAIGTLSLGAREIRMKLDARTLRPVAPEVAELMRNVQFLAIRSGLRRIAELSSGGVVALQLGRIAQESGAERILRRFTDERAAGEWLREADPPSQRAAALISSGRRTASRAQIDAVPAAPAADPRRRTASRAEIEASLAGPGSEPPLSPRRTTWRDLSVDPAPLSPRRIPGSDGGLPRDAELRTASRSAPPTPGPDPANGGKPKG